jgi:hypothetical protein
MGEDEGNKANISQGIPSDDNGVLSRLAVKKSSARTSYEAKKKEEMEIRRKRLMERMIDKSGPDDTGIANAALLKAQKETGNRLSTFPHPPTLPEGVTLRDDPMSKTKAFLTKMPKLV